MNILFTAIQLVLFIASVIALVRAERERDRCHEVLRRCEAVALKLRAERDRVTTLERESDALRRWIKKLEGRFYAAAREEQETPKHELAPVIASAPVCENYARSQTEGPNSEAARCPCPYCEERRQAKRAFRAQEARAGHLDPSWVKAHSAAQANSGEH